MTRAKKRAKVGRGVRNDGRSKTQRPPYASVPADLLGSTVYRGLSGMAMRLHLLLEANFNPNKESFLPHKYAVKMLGASCTTVTRAFRELIAAGIIVKRRDGSRPGRMGAQSEGRAAVSDIPHRSAGPTSTWRQQVDARIEGYWRIDAERLRRLVMELSANELKVYLYLHAVHRLKDGSPVSRDGQSLTAKTVGLPKATLHRVLRALVDKRKVEMVQEASGPKPALYRLAPSEAKGISRKNLPATAMEH